MPHPLRTSLNESLDAQCSGQTLPGQFKTGDRNQGQKNDSVTSAGDISTLNGVSVCSPHAAKIRLFDIVSVRVFSQGVSK